MRGGIYVHYSVHFESEQRAACSHCKSWIPCVCGLIYMMIVEEFHVVPCCLHHLCSSPVEAVIRYR